MTPPLTKPPAVTVPMASVHNILARLASALALAAIALVANFAGPKPFAALVALVALVMAWEWGRMVRGDGVDVTFIVHSAAVMAASGLATVGLAALGLIVLIVGAFIILPLRFGEKAYLSCFGVLYIGLPALALVWLRADEPFGQLAILFLFTIVWATDTAAFAAGRLIGGPKLWAHVSPNKTWAGVFGGALAGLGAGAIFGLWIATPSVTLLAVLGLLLAIVALAGDLAESALKREHGVKDASGLIPGHGGFLDRVDSLVAAVTVAAIIAALVNIYAPARALLLWS